MSLSTSRVLAGSLVLSLFLAAVCTFRQSERPAHVNVESILEDTDRDAKNAVEVHLRRLDSFFNGAKTRTPVFAGNLLGITTKTRYIFQNKTAFSAHLEALFASDVFSQEQLRQAVLQALDGYQAEIAALENRMLVRLEWDATDLPKLEVPVLRVNHHSRTAFDAAMQQIGPDLGADVARLVAFNVSSSVVEAALSRSLSRLTVSGAIFGLSGASSWQTAGISVLAAVAIDYGISKCWEFIADTRVKLVTELEPAD